MSDACSMVGDGDLDAPQQDLDAAVELFATTGVRHPAAARNSHSYTALRVTTATATVIAAPLPPPSPPHAGALRHDRRLRAPQSASY